jgi:hypothetical protein
MCVLEEANEMDESVFDMMITRLRWKAATAIQLPRMILLTSNPDNNWVKSRFYDPWELGTISAPYYYLPALPHENEFLDADYLQTLENLAQGLGATPMSRSGNRVDPEVSHRASNKLAILMG